jgi:hypothetical protein
VSLHANERLLKRIAGAVIVLVAVLAIAFFWQRDANIFRNPAAVVTQVRQLNELATVRYTVQQVVGLREPRYPLGEESLLLVVQASVTAGVNLDHLREEDVTVQDGQIVTVRLPPAQILSVTIDEKETKVWDRRKTWWTPWVPFDREMESRARQKGLEAAREAALGMGILTQAERNAEASIRGLLGMAGAREVRVIPGGAT